MPPACMLTMRAVEKRFGPVRALDGVDLELRGGEVHALIGENGAGKSTLMKILSGAIRPDAGSMTLDETGYAPRTPREARRLGIAMIYQELTIAPYLTVAENIVLGLEHTAAGFDLRRRNRRIALDALTLLGHSNLPLGARAGGIGLANQQIVEIARALVSEARVVVFDEPTSVLPENDVNRLFSVIARLAERGMAIVYISHFLEEVRRIAHRYTVLRDGRSVGSGLMAETSLDDIVRRMVGRTLSEMFPRVPHQPGEIILELDSLSGERLPQGVGLELRRGEILGIAGLVGAGRSELLRCIYGLDPVRSGRVKIALFERAAATPHARIRQGVGLVSEDRKGEGLAIAQSIEDNLTYATLQRHGRLGCVSPRRRRRAGEGWISALRIRATGPDQPVAGLSGGNQQKVAIARLLEQNADILLLDEPTRGIDVGSKVEIYRLIGDLAARGKAIIMVSSYLPELLGVCDRIAVMRRGRLCETRAAAHWSEHEIMAIATGV